MLCTASPLHSVLYCTVSSHRVCFNKTQMPQKVKETKSRVFTRHLTPTTPPSLTTHVRDPWSMPVWSARWESFTTSVTEKYTKPQSTYCVVVHSKRDKRKYALCRLRRTLGIIYDYSPSHVWSGVSVVSS